MLPPKAFYFTFYAAMGSLIPYLVLHYRSIGLSTALIGLLTGIGPLVTLVAAPSWGALADYTHRHRLVLLIAIAGAMAAIVGLSQVVMPLALLGVIAVYAWFSAPIIPLVDNSVLALLGQRRAEYGKQRLWGAVGWGVAGLAAGIITDAVGLVFAFIAFLVFMAGAFLAASRIAVTEANIGVEFWRGLRLLARSSRWVIFLITVLIASIGGGVTNNFIFLYLEDLGATRTLMGWSLMVATLSEIPVFFFSGRLLARFGAPGVLAIGIAGYVVRLVAYSLMPVAWYVLPIQVLHGLTFSAMWVAGVSYAHELAPPGLGATAQGLFTGVTMGLGAAAGAMVGGILYGTLGPRAMFASIAGLVAVGLVIFLISEVLRGKGIGSTGTS